MALIEAVGITAAGQTFQVRQQFRIKRAACQNVIDRAAVNLGGTGYVIQRFGAAFDLERVDADFHQPFHVFNRAQILAVHDVGAVLVFQDWHHFTGS